MTLKVAMATYTIEGPLWGKALWAGLGWAVSSGNGRLWCLQSQDADHTAPVLSAVQTSNRISSL